MSRGWLAPLSLLYAAAAGCKNAAYDHGWLHPRRLSWPVISVGNLSVGGAGKTPVVLRLAELLTARGFTVSVLSRGYGRDSVRTELVDAAGTAAQFGDEPLLMARRFKALGLGTQVVVGADRFSAGLLAESLGPASERRVHLLDDGFQHRRLARDVDIVVVHRSDLEGRLLPAGRLREPVNALRRASLIVLRQEDADLEPLLRNRGSKAPIWFVRRTVLVPERVRRAVAFCGIARPQEFFKSLEQGGVAVARRVSFPDHHRYTLRDAEALRRSALECDADGFLTTEKDAVRLDASLLAQLTVRDQPLLTLHTAELRVEFTKESTAIDELLRMTHRV